MDLFGDGLPTADLHADPHRVFRELRRHAPVWRLPGQPAFLVSTWELVAEAVRRVEDFSNHFRYLLFSNADGTLGALETGPTGPDVFAGADPPDHLEHRRIVFPELVRKKIDTLEPYVTRVTDGLLDRLLDGRAEADAASGLAHLVPVRVVAGPVIGFEDPDLDQLRGWVFNGARLTGGLLTLDELAAATAEVAGMAEWTSAQLEAARPSPTDGTVLGALAAAVNDGALTRDEAAFTLMVLVGAGTETTTSLLGLAVGLLAERPELQAELRTDPERVPAFVEEVLRFESPFRFHPRTAAGPVTLGGVEIPEGSLVLLLWSAANRDETVFDDPDEIRVNRPNNHQHFGFGRGIHHCVGAPLARLEARVVLTRLLERTASFSLDPSRPQRWAPSIWVHRHESLPLVVEAR